MATIPESLVFSCSSNLRRPLPPSLIPSSPANSLSGHRKFGSLPQSIGLRIQTHPTRSLTSLSSRNFKVSRRSSRIFCEAQETTLDFPTVTDATWKSLVLKADGPVLVEFWAPWCGPCRMIHPVVAELSTQYAGRLQCFKLNTDESPSIASQYGIRSIPTTMIFVNGKKKDAVIGAVPKTTLTSTIEKYL